MAGVFHICCRAVTDFSRVIVHGRLQNTARLGGCAGPLRFDRRGPFPFARSCALRPPCAPCRRRRVGRRRAARREPERDRFGAPILSCGKLRVAEPPRALSGGGAYAIKRIKESRSGIGSANRFCLAASCVLQSRRARCRAQAPTRSSGSRRVAAGSGRRTDSVMREVERCGATVRAVRTRARLSASSKIEGVNSDRIAPALLLLVSHDLFRQSGAHFAGSCSKRAGAGAVQPE
jgi:hypothetical protein